MEGARGRREFTPALNTRFPAHFHVAEFRQTHCGGPELGWAIEIARPDPYAGLMNGQHFKDAKNAKAQSPSKKLRAAIVPRGNARGFQVPRVRSAAGFR